MHIPIWVAQAQEWYTKHRGGGKGRGNNNVLNQTQHLKALIKYVVNVVMKIELAVHQNSKVFNTQGTQNKIAQSRYVFALEGHRRIAYCEPLECMISLSYILPIQSKG
jgi:hypothetical protein